MKIGDQVEVTTGSWTGSVGTVVDKQAPPSWVTHHSREPRYLVRLPRGMEQPFRASELKVVSRSHATMRRGKKSPAQLQREIDETLSKSPGRSHAMKTDGQAQFVSFDTWDDVLDAARRGERLWYHAPLNLRPASIRVVKVFKNGKIRIDPLSSDADNFTADEGHLNRFRKRA